MIQNYHLYFQSLEDAKELGREELEEAVTDIIEKFGSTVLINSNNNYQLNSIEELRLDFISYSGISIDILYNSGFIECAILSDFEIKTLLLIYDALIALQVK